MGDSASVLSHLRIWVAVQPAFTDLGRRDHGMLAGARVLARVTIRRAVAAQGGSAFLAGAQMHPTVAALYALLAHAAFGLLYGSDRNKMSAGLIGHPKFLYSSSTQ